MGRKAKIKFYCYEFLVSVDGAGQHDGKHAAILAYCCVDTATTERAYLLMTGQAADLS